MPIVIDLVFDFLVLDICDIRILKCKEICKPLFLPSQVISSLTRSYCFNKDGLYKYAK